MTPNADMPDHIGTLWVRCGFTCIWFGLASLRYRIICLFTQLDSLKWVSSDIIKWQITSGWCLSLRWTNCSQNTFLEAKWRSDSSGTVCNVYGWKFKEKRSICWRDLFDILRATECLRTDLVGLWPIAARTILMYDPAYWICVCCRRRASKFQYPVLDVAAIRNRSMPPQMLKCRLNIGCVITELLSL